MSYKTLLSNQIKRRNMLEFLNLIGNQNYFDGGNNTVRDEMNHMMNVRYQRHF